MSAFDELEQLLLTLRTTFVYKLPKLGSATAGHQAAGWDLGNPLLTAVCKVYQRNNVAFIRLYEKKGIQERLFAQCKIDLSTVTIRPEPPGRRRSQSLDSAEPFLAPIHQAKAWQRRPAGVA